MKSIKFDLSCFKAEFQEFIFKKLNCNDYFEFINSYNNDFILNIDNCEQDVKVPILEEDIQSCTYKNISKECIEESSSIVQSELNNENMYQKGLDPHYLIDRYLAKFLPYFNVPRTKKVHYVIIGPNSEVIDKWEGSF